MSILYLITFFLLFNVYTYLSIYVHEIGHFLSAKLLGAKETRITFNFKKVNPITSFNFGRDMSKMEDFVITISGVLFQLIFSIILFIQDYSLIMKVISIIYIPGILINILPHKPLDGFYLTLLFNRKKIVITILYSIFFISTIPSVYFTWLLLFTSQEGSLFKTILFMTLPILFLTKMARKINWYRSRVIEYEIK